MTTWKQLSRPLRLAVAAPSCVLAAFVTLAFVGGVELRLDDDHKPLSEVSLASSRWIGTLDAARLPDSVPLLAPDGSLTLPGGAVTLTSIFAADGDQAIQFAGSTGYLTDDGAVALQWDHDGVTATHLTAGGSFLDSDGSATFANGNVTIDSSGDISAYGSGSFGNIGGGIAYLGSLSVDTDAYLGGNLTLGQAAQAGTITPNRTLTLYDVNGTAYLIPCVAR